MDYVATPHGYFRGAYRAVLRSGSTRTSAPPCCVCGAPTVTGRLSAGDPQVEPYFRPT
jgi:hypothetical protein